MKIQKNVNLSWKAIIIKSQSNEIIIFNLLMWGLPLFFCYQVWSKMFHVDPGIILQSPRWGIPQVKDKDCRSKYRWFHDFLRKHWSNDLFLIHRTSDTHLTPCSIFHDFDSLILLMRLLFIVFQNCGSGAVLQNVCYTFMGSLLKGKDFNHWQCHLNSVDLVMSDCSFKFPL
jgi:hypothetical protein